MEIESAIRGAYFRGPVAEDKIRDWIDGIRCGPVRLEPEDGNEHDANAVKILIDDMHVGYVPRETNAQVREWLAAGRVGTVWIAAPWHVKIEVI